MRSNNTPNRYQSGTHYTRRHIDDDDLLHHHRRSTSSRRNTYTETSVVTATAIPVEQHRHTYDGSGSGSTYNDTSSEWEQYDSKRWEDNNDNNHQHPPQHAAQHNIQQEDNNNRHSLMEQRPLTDLHGPMGTRGGNSRPMSQEQYNKLLNEGYSTGLANALSENQSRYDFRFWVVDNSGSMQIGDGHRLVKKDGEKQKAIPCTRWEEIKETVKYHANMAAVLDCPTIFQLLNNPGLKTIPQRFSVCEHGSVYAQQEVSQAMEIMRKISPTGVTPLTQHIWDIEEQISGMARELRETGKIVAIILATDGMPTDELGYGGEQVTNDFIRALRSLEGLPIWTVIRLCTDEDEVKEFYNNLDTQLEISLEVLDDYKGEAREVYRQNPWITYALPLHRCRELGYHDRLFDLIDERPLTMGEARLFCCFILGVTENELPDPAVDSSAFISKVKAHLAKEALQWNPIKKKMTPWILVKDLKKSFSDPLSVRILHKFSSGRR